MDDPVLSAGLLPAPREVTGLDAAFVIGRQTIIQCQPALDDIADWLAETLERPMGFRLGRGRRQTDAIHLRLDDRLKFEGDEAYRIEVQPGRVEISGRTPRGVVWGIQTLRQLLGVEIFAESPVGQRSWSIPCCIVEDAPAFGWRGMMLDCARHFMPIEFIYRWIDLLSLHKLNVFHWHLTDDQGWRIEIKKYPRLTEIGAWRKQTLIGHALPKRNYDTFDGQPHGGFYTQDQVRDVVRYAAVRGVTVVPEIEMPGHAQAAIAAYPELGNLNQPLEVWDVWGINLNIVNVEDATIQFFKDVLDEVIELFPSKFIHIGGDEAPKDQWRDSSAAQSKMQALGLKDEDALQSWFIRQVNEHLISRGRRMIGWDEILEGGLADGAAVMSWRGEAGGIAAARAGHDVVMSPSQTVYFDHYQTADRVGEPLAIGGCSTLQDVYEYQPLPAALEDAARQHVLGAQANLWTEYVPTPEHAQYMAFPRACALAEILWSDPCRDWPAFQSRLARHLDRLTRLNIHYRR